MQDSQNVFQKNLNLVRIRLGFLKCQKSCPFYLEDAYIFLCPVTRLFVRYHFFLSHSLPLVLPRWRNLYIRHFLERKLVVKGVTSAIANQELVYRSRDTNGPTSVWVENDDSLIHSWAMHSGICGTKNVTSSSSNRALIGPFVSRDLYTRSWLATGGNDAVNYSGWGSGLADNNGWDYGIEFVEKDGKRQERLNLQSRSETLITPANFVQDERTEKAYREASSYPSPFHESFGLFFCSSSRDEPGFSLPFQILQLLMDIDSLLLKWRCKFFINKCN